MRTGGNGQTLSFTMQSTNRRVKICHENLDVNSEVFRQDLKFRQRIKFKFPNMLSPTIPK